MKIIKEIRPADGVRKAIAIVRTNCYASNLTLFGTLFTVALRDYPGLEQDACRVVQFGGDRYAGTFGIEFNPPDNEIRPGWTIVNQLEKLK